MKKRLIPLLLILTLLLGACATTPADTSSQPAGTSSEVSGEASTEASDETSSEESGDEGNQPIVRPTDYPTLCGNFMQPGTFKGYSVDKLKSHLQTMYDVGIDILILQWSFENTSEGVTSVYYDASFESADKASLYNDSGKNLLGNILKAAEEVGVKVFVGLNNNDEWWQKGVNDKAWLTAQTEIGVEGAKQIYDTYKELYPNAFYGWYFVFEFYNMNATQAMLENAAYLLNGFRDELTKLDDSMPMMLSPFISSSGPDAEKTGEMWKNVFAMTNFLEGDIFCCQDSVGAGHITIDQLDGYYKAIKAAVDTKKGLRFWANNEDFNQAVWGTAPLDRFVKQMEISHPYVEAHITFAYSHYQHPDMGKMGYHQAYKTYYETGKLPETTLTAPEVSYELDEAGGAVTVSGTLQNPDKTLQGFRIFKNGEEVQTIDLSTEYGKASMTFSFADYDSVEGGKAEYEICGLDYYGNQGPVTKLSVSFTPRNGVNVAEGKSYTMLKQPEGNYPDEKGNAFTDGKLGEPTYGDAAWSGFLGKPEFVIDLGEKVNGIYSVRLNTLGGGSAAIYAPNQVTIYVSDDGENFTQVASKTFAADVNAGSLNVVVRNVTLPEDASARYVKIAVATNQSWIFIDEISVYAE